jgi:UDP-N-acetylmuramoyl-tripeptide--D-alanyl-D-alanine ligase
LEALHKIAAVWRKGLAGTFVGVTGSCGKTTTKALIAHLLREDMQVFAAPESFNTEVGLPLALLGMPHSAEIGIFELGTNAPGEIASLAALLAPQVGVLTMVGRVHLEGFGTLETIADEKWDLIRALPQNGVGIIPADSPVLARLIEREKRQLISFGLEQGDLQGRITQTVPNLRLRISDPPLELDSPLMGEHNAVNLLAAVGCALHLGVSPHMIEKRVATLEPIPHRLQLIHAPLGYILDDSYNANPGATWAALRVLAELDLPVKRRAFVFGDMLELGKDSIRYHKEILELALGLGISPIFPVGEAATTVARNIRDRIPKEKIIFADKEELPDRVRKRLRGDRNLLLVKGSRLLGLEKLVGALSN